MDLINSDSEVGSVKGRSCQPFPPATSTLANRPAPPWGRVDWISHWDKESRPTRWASEWRFALSPWDSDLSRVCSLAGSCYVPCCSNAEFDPKTIETTFHAFWYFTANTSTGQFISAAKTSVFTTLMISLQVSLVLVPSMAINVICVMWIIYILM